MKEYHKIATVWERDPETKFKTLIEGAWATPAFEYLASSAWVWTEKVDGTNIRVMWDGATVRFGGKTDRAQIPAILVERLEDRFTAARMNEVFGDRGDICLYGEGYGSRIQKAGKNYNPGAVDFVLFDVRAGDVWLERDNVLDVSRKLIFDPDPPAGFSAVPPVGVGTLNEAIRVVRNGLFKRSCWGDFPPEGLVMRPLVELTDRMGDRVIAKVKRADFGL